MEFYYSKLAARMMEIKKNHEWHFEERADVWPDAVIRRALDGEQLPLSYALRVKRLYFPNEDVTELFQPDSMTEGRETLSFAECVKTLEHSFLGEVMTSDEFEAVEYFLHHTNDNKNKLLWATPAGYVLGYAAGVRSERARKEHKQSKPDTEPHTSGNSDKLAELIEIMGQLSAYDANFVTVTARTLLKIEKGE